MTADLQSLIDRAAAATTLAEECDVIRDAVDRMAGERCVALLRLTREITALRQPRACLLGVVASLVPAGALWAVASEDADPFARVMLAKDGSFIGREYAEANANTPALALLIALCRALQSQEAHHVG